MGKKIKKAVKKVTKPFRKAAKQAVGIATGGILSSPDTPDTPDPIPPAVEVAAPKEDAETTTDKDTVSSRRKTQSRGKSKLTVARASGRGLNI